MLTLTSGAVQVIRTVTANPELPPETGIRIASGVNGSQTLSLSVAPAPEAGDEIVEEEGARVYLEPGAAELLQDKTLDAQVDPQGDVAFTIGDSPGTPA
ncbi:Fe-S cluster assembly iron-binding protein IscA [Thermomonospora echinospora]|uniref:Fe-S cluster assembly iron-binding protein IscA n=1 Tax=Thermomonospora echinospora TaxID=1992 RepID=A0A1H5W2Z3_9ACTN|nr:Fe-S cluster assembly protein HesB [Thermomonospora echinospora]SEF93688.1 Fe-S cluster assembly iron-binding protein IscA [Thermomonospora echinospora]